MEACFHLKKKKKLIVTFYRLLTCISYGSLFSPQNKKKEDNCNFLSHNSVFFFSELRDIILQLRVINSELWDINLWEKESEIQEKN